jgi:hypothetical protein
VTLIIRMIEASLRTGWKIEWIDSGQQYRAVRDETSEVVCGETLEDLVLGLALAGIGAKLGPLLEHGS